ncbi:MAG: VWA domain-containing protein [Ignavibacteriae bacterium]|nr:VWA domain-containing protein [Ignavibacteriota bacterium]
MRYLLRISVIFLFTAVSTYAQNNYVFLFDNSGSMSGYYRQDNSSFKLFSKALIKNSVKQGDHADIMLFSKTEPDRGMQSPKGIFSGGASELNTEAVMKEFQIQRAGDGKFGRTDLIEALDKGIASLGNEKGIIWLVTDNINDNSGSGDMSYQNTLDFYQRLRTDANIRKILLYPIPEFIVEDGDTAKGYVVYGMVYSPEPLSQAQLSDYDKILRGIGIKQKPITLKPLDIGTIVLQPQKTQSQISGGKLYFDGKTLRGFDFEEGEPVKEIFNDLSLKSNLYPYIIKSAKLSVRLDNFSSSDYSVKSMGTQTITPSTVSNVSPEGEVTGFAITFNLPEISPNFSFNTIFKEDFTVGGNLILEVSDVEIELDQAYMDQFRQLFALQTVPEIFQPVLKDKRITTDIPLEIRILYGPWRTFVLIGLIALLVAIIGLLAFLLFRKRCFGLKINNEDEMGVCVTPISSYSVSHGYSPELGKIKKSLFGDLRFHYSKRTSTPGKSVSLVEGLPIEIDYEDEDLKPVKILLSITNSAKSSESDEHFGEGLSEFY